MHRYKQIARSWLLPTSDGESYHRAAVIYFIYGMVYMGGAIAKLTPERKVDFFGTVPWWTFYLIGALALVGFPIMVWFRFKWFTRIIAFGPTVKAITLIGREGRSLMKGEPMNLFYWIFAVVAVWAAVYLFRAGWGRERRKDERGQGVG